MNDKQRAAMRNSFKRVSAMGLSATPGRLSDSDIKALAVIGITEPALEPYAPVSIEEARRLLEDVSSSYSRSKLDDYLDDAQDRVMEAIIKPFGLAKMLFEEGEAPRGLLRAFEKDKYNDKHYRTSKFRRAADELKEVKAEDAGLHDPNFKMHHYYENCLDDSFTDGYSGGEISRRITDVEHIYSTKKFHEEGGYMLSPERRRDFAADPENLTLINQSTNRSIGQKDKLEWQKQQATDGINITNKELHKQDNRRVKPALNRGEKVAQRHLPTNYEKTKFYTKRIIETEEVRMGLQQAIGVFLLELARAMHIEIKDILVSGIYTDTNQSFIRAIGERLKKVGEHVLSKWKDVMIAFRDGAISGFLSNLISSVVKMFFKSVKNAVRMIREGFMSLVRGIKFILSPPDGFSKAEACHEAGKVVIGGISVSLGILAEEAVINGIAMIPVMGQFIQPFAGYIAPVIAGIAVGLGTCFLCYLWDKLDLFDAEEGRRHKFIMETLERQKNLATEAADTAVAERDQLVQDCDKMLAEIEEIDSQFWALAGA